MMVDSCALASVVFHHVHPDEQLSSWVTRHSNRKQQRQVRERGILSSQPGDTLLQLGFKGELFCLQYRRQFGSLNVEGRSTARYRMIAGTFKDVRCYWLLPTHNGGKGEVKNKQNRS